MASAPSRRPAGFTLIELLVVLSIMAVLSSMIFVLVRDEEGDAVLAAAYELQATVAKGRAMATTTNKDHAITFHIEGPPGGGGEVVRNFAPSDPPDFQGRHWYALIGPVGSANKGDPYPANHINRRWMVPQMRAETESEYRTRVRAAQIGPRHHLPRGVRFLALSDVDGGITYDGSLWFNGAYGFLWPRPWFGALLPTGSGYRLYPWGSNGTWGVPPTEPLTVGELMDAMLLFRGDGQINLLHTYRNRPAPEMGEFSSVVHGDLTGGVHITLCRDVDPGDEIYTQGNLYDFASERDAIASILPLARVFVHATDGTVEVRKGPSTPEDPFGGHEFTRIRMNQRSGQDVADPASGTTDQANADFIPPRSAYHLDDGRASFNQGY